VQHRGLITVSIMLATIMQALDTTIANVALPHMQGSLSATQDQITWVLTSYIVAAAIMTPLTGWLAGRFGASSVFLVCVAGFTVASMLCGAGAACRDRRFRCCRASSAPRWCRCRRRCCSTSTRRERHGSGDGAVGLPASWSARSSARPSAAG
jgi:DHA2 family multidrug resistance protein